MFENVQINSKAAFVKEQISDRISRGATVLEMQLLGEFVENKEIDIEMIKDVDICSIHMPLFNGKDTAIEYVDSREYFKKACKLASDIGKLKNHNIIIVIHTSMQPSELKALGIYDEVANTIRDELDKYDNVEVAIENTAMHDYRRDSQIWIPNGTISIENGVIKFANVELVKAINHERCGICFDVCHAIMNENNLKYIDGAFENIAQKVSDDKTLFDIAFEQMAPTIKLVHLAYVIGNGFNELHGLPFTDENIECLQYFNNLYQKYNLNCPITIEVYEDDICCAENYTRTINIMKNAHNI